MLSRVARNLYWMSRYLERTEHTTRSTVRHEAGRLLSPEERDAQLKRLEGLAAMSDADMWMLRPPV